MAKYISTQKLRTNVGEVIDSVRLRGDRYVIKRRGQPVAALVPLNVIKAYEANRDRFFEVLNTIAERNKDMSSNEITALVAKTVNDVRKAKLKPVLRFSKIK